MTDECKHVNWPRCTVRDHVRLADVEKIIDDPMWWIDSKDRKQILQELRKLGESK